MTTTVVATPEPTHSPPRVRLDLTAAKTGYLLGSAALTRGGDPVRVSTGGTYPRTVYDYDADFDTSLAYEMDATYILDSWTTLWDETFASGWKTNWTGTSWGSPSAGFPTTGTAVTATGLQGAARPVPTSTSRITYFRHPGTVGTSYSGPGYPECFWELVDSSGNVIASLYCNFQESGNVVVGIGLSTADSHVIVPGGYANSAPVWNTVRMTLATDLSGVTFEMLDSTNAVKFTTFIAWPLATPGPSSYFRFTGGTPYSAYLPTTIADRVLVEQHNTGSATETGTASATLSPEGAWLYHPYDPDTKSIQVESLTSPACSGLFITSASATQMDRPSLATVLQPLGSARGIAINLGPRRDPGWTLELATKTAADYSSVVDLFADDVPLRFAYPVQMGQHLVYRWTGAPNASTSEKIVDGVVTTTNWAEVPIPQSAPVNEGNNWHLVTTYYASSSTPTLETNGGPLGGIPYLRKTILDSLHTAGAQVFVIGCNPDGATINPTTFGIPVTPGETLCISVYSRNSKGLVPGWAYAYWSADGQTKVSSGPNFSPLSSGTKAEGAWTRRWFSVLVPDGVTRMGIRDNYNSGASAPGDTFDATALQVDKGVTAPSDFFTGNTPDQISCDDAWLIPQGWYSPGDLTETRDHPKWSSPLRRWSTALTPVAAPAAPPE